MEDPTGPNPDDAPEGMGTTTIGDLIRECQTATAKMSTTNPNRRLLFNCAFAMQQMVERHGQLVERLDMYENPKRRM